MNRLQKKCMIGSAGIHLLLALMLLFGPGFISSHSHDEGTPPLTFIALKTVDEAISGGGDNTVKAPPAALVEPPTIPAPVTPPTPITPPVVQQTPPPQPRVERDPTPAPREPDTARSDVPVDKPAPRKHHIDVDTTIVTASATDVKAMRDAQAKAAAAAAADKRRRTEALNRAVAGIRGGVAGSTEVRLSGPGGGGVPYGNFLSAVEKVYYDAWNVPDGVPDVTVRVSVTIARDGTVISARITDNSGTAAVDDSVQRALERVKFAAPLPDSEKNDQRTVTIRFNTQAKLEG